MESSINCKLLIFFAFSLYIIVAQTTAHDDATCDAPHDDAPADTGSNEAHPLPSEKDAWLKAHNEARAMNHLPAFTWDPKLEDFSRDYGMQRAGDCAIIHSNGPYGENLFEGGGVWPPSDAVKWWMDEVQWYDMETNTCQPGKMCLHYTQIIWKSTKRVGCARIKCNKGSIFAVCEYDPPGNFVGEKPLDGIEH